MPLSSSHISSPLYTHSYHLTPVTPTLIISFFLFRCSAIGVFLIIFLGSSFTAKRFFGIFISVVIEMLAVGLITGSMHSWEETHEMR